MPLILLYVFDYEQLLYYIIRYLFQKNVRLCSLKRAVETNERTPFLLLGT
jgi:hypothetical protein